MMVSRMGMVPALLLVAATATATARDRGEARVVRVATTAEALESAGSVAVAEHARREAGGRTMTVCVPIVQADRLSRAEALRHTELLIKEIERATPARVVVRPGDADLILEATLSSTPRP